MRILSWNINGLQAAVRRAEADPGWFVGVLERAGRPDVVCLQEIRCDASVAEGMLRRLFAEVPKTFRHFDICCSTTKKGYAGVATVSSVGKRSTTATPTTETATTPTESAATQGEGRVLVSRLSNGWTVVNVYAPNSGTGLGRLAERLAFDADLRELCVRLASDPSTRATLCCGDLNVAEQDVDVHAPKQLRRSAGFTRPERESFGAFRRAFARHDLFREKHPDAIKYTYFSPITRARARNAGWRIDYILSDVDVRVTECDILDDVEGSDHVPVYAHVFRRRSRPKKSNDRVETPTPTTTRVETPGMLSDAFEDTKKRCLKSEGVLALLVKEIYEMDKDSKFGARAYRRVREDLLGSDVAYVDEFLSENPPGVGEKIRRTLTSCLSAFDRAKVDEATHVSRLLEVPFVGIRTAVKMVRSTDPRGSPPEFATRQQRICFRHIADLKRPIPRSEMRAHEAYIKRMLAKDGRVGEVIVAGSYRRGRAESGDIDIVVVPAWGRGSDETCTLSAKTVGSMLPKDYLLDTLASGDRKLLGVCRHPSSDTVRRLDIIVPMTRAEVPFATLYFTGPADFVVRMRKKAASMGLHLDEKGLHGWPHADEILDEKGVFDALGIDYLSPRQRESSSTMTTT